MLVLIQGQALRHGLAARRLRYRNRHDEVGAPPIGAGGYHLFLSHVWGTGQDQMRVVKQRLLEMMPALRVFLDVDEAGFEIGNLESYVEKSRVVLVFCSDGYASSANCMRELRAAVSAGKPLIALLELSARHGG